MIFDIKTLLQGVYSGSLIQIITDNFEIRFHPPTKTEVSKIYSHAK